jgi:hypothetical protein
MLARQYCHFLLNEVIWKSVRGASSQMPAPIHAAFVFAHGGDNDD